MMTFCKGKPYSLTNPDGTVVLLRERALPEVANMECVADAVWEAEE